MFNLDNEINQTRLDHVEVWNRILKLVENAVPNMTYNTWFVPIKPLALNSNKLLIELPHPLFWEWIAERFDSLITDSINKVLGPGGRLDITYPNKDEDVEKLPPPPPRRRIQILPVEPAPKTTEEVDETYKAYNNLQAKYQFDNFIKGDGNQLAHAAAVAVSQNPGGTSFNPLFIYGGVGLGKTHLIQAVGNAVLNRDSNRKIIYTSSDKFTVDFVAAVQADKVSDFSNFYRNVDVLIIDDIQFLTGKEKTQDLFFQIFNELYQSGKQIILSSDKPPKDIKGISERLISRFNWGMLADIQPPDYETRIAILNKKAEAMGVRLEREIIDYVATQITSNIRELEGCLIKILATSSLGTTKINLDLAKKIVREISTAKRIDISIDIITKITSEYLGIDEKKIRDKTRKAEVVLARQISMFLSKQLTKSSLKNIGLHFGGRDHSTVIHACTAIEEEMNKDRNFKSKVHEIKTKIELACS